MHYITDDLNSSDNERDSQMPFKSIETYISNSTFVCIPNLSLQQPAPRAFIISKTDRIITKDLVFDTDFNFIVWHPPKYSS